MTTHRGHATDGYDRRVTPARPDLAAARLKGKVAASRYVEGQPMRVIAEASGLRGAPGPEESFDTQALFGERVTAYDMDDEGWAWVQLDRDGYVGYVSANDLAPVAHAATHTTLATRTFVYPAPSMKTPPLLALPMLAQVRVSDVDGAFARIEGSGFVWADHLAPADHVEPDYVAVAERFEHTPYLWGGKTWAGLDCSGLVQIALQSSGLEAPRDTDMQVKALGESVDPGTDFSALSRGDIVFWKGHVGLICDADTLLHASGAHMQVVREPFHAARARILRAGNGDVTGVRRIMNVRRP